MFILKPNKISSVSGKSEFAVVDAAEISLDIKASRPICGVACQLTDPSNPELSCLSL